MLNLPTKMVEAIDRGTFRPCVYGEITTSVLDAPPSSQTVVRVGVVNAGALGEVIEYPADPGDPNQTYPLIQQAFAEDRALAFAGPIFRGRGPSLSFGGSQEEYQTFTHPEDSYIGNKLKSVSVRVSRRQGDANWEVRCRIYRADENGNLLDFAGRAGIATSFGDGGVESATTHTLDTLPLIPSVGTISFDFDLDLIPAQRYAILIYVVYLAPTTAITLVNSGWVIWYGAESKSNPNEFSFERDAGTLIGRDRELSLQVDVAAYSYDGVTRPYADFEIDLGAVPVSDGEYSFQDVIPTWHDPVTGTTLTTAIEYHAWGGNSPGAKDIDLGIVQDRSAITTLRQYYVIRATLYPATATTLIRTPAVISVNILFATPVQGFPKLYGFSSHRLPFAQAEAIASAPSLPMKLDLGRPITQRGAITLDLVDIGEEVTRIAIEESLLNRPVEIRLGDIDAQEKADMLLIGRGRVTDYQYKEGRLTITIEDRTKQLDVKIPRAKQDGKLRRSYAGKELIDALKEIILNDAGITRGWLDQASFESVRTFLKGDDATSLWITHRVIEDDPQEAKDLVEDILELIGAYLVPQEDGVIRLVRFPRSGTSVATWDETILSADEEQPGGILKSIVNQVYVFYDRDGDGENRGVVISVDADAQADQAPGSEVSISDRTIETEWLGPEEQYHGETLAGRIGKRILKTYKDGVIPFRATTALDQLAVQVGDFVDITSPVFLKKGQLGSTARQFMVSAKDIDIENGRIRWELIEAIDFNRPPTAIISVDTAKGDPPLTVNFDGTGSVDPDGTIVLYEWDFDYDGVDFTVDATGSTAQNIYQASSIGVKRSALRVTDDNGAQHTSTKLIRVLGDPVSLITYTLSGPDQTFQAILSSASYGITGAIVKEEWDLSYDGITFNSEVTADTVTINLPYQSVTIALRVTDEDGKTNTATLLLAGKQLLPSDVTGFFVFQVGDKLNFNWSENPEEDLYAYEIRRKYEPTGSQTATWDTADVVAREILTTNFVGINQRPFGTYTYLIKAINLTGRYSQNATAIVTETIDPQDRNVIVTQDEKALGWPGIKTQLTYDVGLDQWWIDASGPTIASLPDDPISGIPNTQLALLGTSYADGSYETQPIDLGGVLSPVRLSATVDTQSLPDADQTRITVLYRSSEISIPDMQAKAYVPIKIGDLRFQFVQVKVLLEAFDPAWNIALRNLITSIDVPDLIDSNEDIDVAIGGTNITFAVSFNVVPSILVTIQNLTTSHYVEVYNKTKTGFGMRVRRASDDADVGSSGTRLVDFQAIGY